MKKLLPLIFLFIISVEAQIYPPAVEVWSEPVRVDSLAERFKGEDSPFLTVDMMTLYLFKTSAICVSHKVDTLWSLPVSLNNNVNNGNPIRHPSISYDKERLYYSRWGGYGNWDLWYSPWDSASKDWKTSMNLEQNVNNWWGDYYVYELSEDTLYCINDLWAGQGVCIYVKDSISNDWEIVDSSNYSHPFGYGDIRGLSITADRRKAYFSRYISLIADSLQSELYMTFWDTLENHWGDVYELNINSNAFQPQGSFGRIGGWDEYPWISPDGKVLFFTSNRDAAREDTTTAPDIYMSILLIDENGNPVSVNDLPDVGSIINNCLLHQNYPNPLNSTTNIKFFLPKSYEVSLIIYDILGNEIFNAINNQTMSAGWHNYQLNFNSIGGDKYEISSGVFIYKLTTSGESLSKKLLYLK